MAFPAARMSLALAVIAIGFLDFCTAITGGQSVNRCAYPGLAVVTKKNGNPICNAAVVATKTLKVSASCRFAMNGVNAAEQILVNTGKNVYTIPIGGFTAGATSSDGVLTFDLSSATVTSTTTSDCFTEGTLATSSDTVDSSTCVVVGVETTSSAVYNPNSTPVNAAPITKLTGATCCKKATIETLGDAQLGALFYDASHTYNCATSSGAACGSEGALLMCKNSAGKMAVIGSVVYPRCNSNDDFLVHDFTGGSDNLKFGYSSA